MGPGEAGLNEVDRGTGPLNSRPLVRTQDGFIIGAPGLLLHALRLRILALAEQTGLLRELAERFADGCWAGVARSLTYLSHDELGQPPLDPGLPAFRHGLFSLDTDKALYVQLASDPLNDYSGQSPDSWHDDQLMGSLQAHAGAVEQDIFSWEQPPNEVLFLYLLVSPGSSLCHRIKENGLTGIIVAAF